MNQPPVKPGPFLTPWPVAYPVDPRRPGPQAFSIGAAPLGGNIAPVLNTSGAGGLSIPNSASAIYDLARFAILNGSKPFSVSTTSNVPLVDQPPSWRNFLHFRNASGSGGANLYINFGDVAAIDGSGIAGSGFKLAPDEQILFDAVVPQDDISALATGGTSQLSVSFSNVNFLESEI